MNNTNYNALIAELEASKAEAEKFFGEKANASAGTRLRAHLQEIAKLSKQVRKDVTELKESRKQAKA